ncbi:MAG: hypothetical protein IT303_14730 [Dehalococcoidia bacterium]|nr:hypothetical protein [Dehalococcoidia bacterium]
MNDAIALLAISQLVCLGALGYLYMELSRMRRARPRREVRAERPAPAAARQAAQQAYAAQGGGPFARDAGNIAQRMNDLGVDVSTLARRMGKSEEEVRLLLRRQGVVR